MGYSYEKISSKCIELSKESTYSSLRELMGLYLDSDKTVSDAAEYAIRKTHNRRIIYEILEEMLEKDEKNRLKLLKLGIHFSRAKYIKRYFSGITYVTDAFYS